MTTTQQQSPDPIALELARRLHRRHPAEATVLFGSRATGHHDPQLSDVDVLLITEKEHSPLDTDQAQEEALALYGQPVKVQLQFKTPLTVAEDADYADTVAGSALAHGIFVGGDPARFPSPYRQPDPAPPRYKFQGYKDALAWSGLLLRSMLIYHTGALPAGETNPVLQTAYLARNTYQDDPDTLYRMVRQSARQSAEKVAECALLAAGVFPSQRQSTTQRLEAAADLYPGGATALTIPPEEYEEPDHCPDMSRQEFVDAVHPELSRLREAAKTLRRRTANRANRARRDWEKARQQQHSTP